MRELVDDSIESYTTKYENYPGLQNFLTSFYWEPFKALSFTGFL